MVKIATLTIIGLQLSPDQVKEKAEVKAAMEIAEYARDSAGEAFDSLANYCDKKTVQCGEKIGREFSDCVGWRCSIDNQAGASRAMNACNTTFSNAEETYEFKAAAGVCWAAKIRAEA